MAITIPSEMEEVILRNVYDGRNKEEKIFTVQEVIDKILLDMCGGPKFEKTCDIISAGDPESVVTGIVTTFMATYDVIQEAVRLGANFIITHEPTWFTGMDETEWCKEDRIYLERKSIWRIIILLCGDFMIICIWGQILIIFMQDCSMNWDGRNIYNQMKKNHGYMRFRRRR